MGDRVLRLKEGESLTEAIARVARGRIDHALDELRGKSDSTPVEAVHEARKDMKKLRALLRMTRGELGDAHLPPARTLCFRDAARELAGVREADVMLDTLRTLDLCPPAGTWELRTADPGRPRAERRRRAPHGRPRSAVAMLREARGA